MKRGSYLLVAVCLTVVCCGGADEQECAPACDGKNCGPDGCGGTCQPGCREAESCTSQGVCECRFLICDGDCCDDGQICTVGGCCTSLCSAKECGPDGCGGTCEPGCGPNETCGPDGLCGCSPSCAGKVCGPDACGGDCPPGCSDDQICNTVTGQCQTTCTPQCEGRECGSDGCQGTCPPGCTGNDACNETTGQCECVPDCTNRVCGPDGCDGLCPPGCNENEICNTTTGQCDCVPTTCAEAGANCGTIPDGCGGSLDCGECCAGDTCIDGYQCCESAPFCVTDCLADWFACNDHKTCHETCGTAGHLCSATEDCCAGLSCAGSVCTPAVCEGTRCLWSQDGNYPGCCPSAPYCVADTPSVPNTQRSCSSVCGAENDGCIEDVDCCDIYWCSGICNTY